MVAWFSEPRVHGIASPDTFERLFAVLHPKGFERAFREWVAGVIPALRHEQVITIDGKTSRRTTSKAAAAPLHMVSAFAAEKARRLAAGRKMDVRFMQVDMLAPGWPPAELHNAFDWVVGIFIQFVGPEWRERQFEVMKQLTRPGGRILLQGYTPKQLDYRTGGPSAIENLYTPETLQEAFADWVIEELVEYEEDIAEGSGHRGRSALIGMVARKPD